MSEMGGHDDRYTLHVGLENELSGPAKVVEQSLEDVGDKARDGSVQLALFEMAAEKAGDSAAKAGAKAAAGAKGLNEFGDEAAEAAVKARLLERQSKKTQKGLIGYLNFGISFRKIFGAIKYLAIVDGIAAIAGGLVGLGAAAIGALGVVGPLVGVLGAVPGVVGAGIQALATFKFGLSGMGEGLKAVLDPKATAEDVAQALQDIGPSGRMVLFVLRDMNEEWKDMKQNVQEALLQGMAPVIRDLGTQYIPILNRGLSLTATHLNDVLRYTAAWLNDPAMRQTIESVMNSNANVAGNVGRGISGGMRLFVEFLAAAGPMLEEMSADFEVFMGRMADLTRDRRGGLSNWLSESYEQWKDIWTVLKDFSAALFNVVKGAAPLTKAMGGDLSDVAENFRAWTESTEGQRSMKDFFTDMIPVVRELGNWIIDIGKALVGIARTDTFLEISRVLRTEALPIIAELGDKMGGKFVPLFVDFLELLEEMVDAGLIDTLSESLNVMMGVLGAMVDVFKALPGPLQGVVGQLLVLSMLIKMTPGLFLGAMVKKGFKLWKNELGAISTKAQILRGGSGLLGLGLLMSDFGDTTTNTGKAIEITTGALGGAAMGFAVGGPWGAAIGGAIGLVWGLAEAFNGVKTAVDNASLEQASYIDTLDNTTAAITSMTKQKVAMDLENAGILKLAEKYGFRTQDLVSSAMGNNQARDRVWDRARKWMVSHPNASDSAFKEVDDMLEGLGVVRGSLRSEVDVLNRVNRAAGLGSKSAGDLATQMNKGEDRTGRWVDHFGVMRKEIKSTIPLAQNLAGLLGVPTGKIKPKGPSSTFFGGMGYWDQFRTPPASTAMNGPYRTGYQPGIPGFYKGGIPALNKMSMVGERGPEAFVTPGGKMSMVGQYGPELRRFSEHGAIIPASATADPFGGATGNAPQWAVRALQRAYEGAGASQGHQIPGRAADRQGTAEKHYHMHTGPIYPQSAFDVDRAINDAFDKMQRESEERE